jgi:hypothetical protein
LLLSSKNIHALGEAIPDRNPENGKSRPENPENFTMKLTGAIRKSGKFYQVSTKIISNYMQKRKKFVFFFEALLIFQTKGMHRNFILLQ